MNCEKYIDMIPLFLLDELDGPAAEELKEHIKECKSCRIELEDMKLTISALESSNARELSELECLRVQNEVYKSLFKTSTSKQITTLRITRIFTRIAAAVVIFMAGYGTSFFMINNSHLHQNGQSANIEEYTLSQDHKLDLSGYKFTPEGLKVIAKGKKAFLESN